MPSVATPRRNWLETAFVKLIRIGFLVAAVAVISWTTTDPDLWGHVLFGRDIVLHLALPVADPYSFTSDRQWVNHEWLAEVLMFLAYDAGGTRGLIALKALVVIGAFALVLLTLRPAALRPPDHDLLLGIALVGMISRFHPVRPQVFSLLLFAALLYVLRAADRGSRKSLMFVPVFMALWANLHGGYVVGLGVLAMWLLVRLVQRKDIWSRIVLVAVGGCGLAATLINPYGVGLWKFLWETVGLSRPHINDWQPIFSHGFLLLVPFILVTLVAIVALIKTRGRVDPAYLLIVLALALATIRISRLDAFFTLSVMMLLGPYLGRQTRPADAAVTSTEPVSRVVRMAFATAAALIISGGTMLAFNRVQCLEVRGVPEPEATNFFSRNALSGHLLTSFDWGEYAIWHLSPHIKVSIDGRRETVYSDDTFESHVSLYRDEPGATSLVRTLNPDYIWLPADWAVVARLQQEGWRSVFKDQTSTVLSRDEPVLATKVEGTSVASRCFPG